MSVTTNTIQTFDRKGLRENLTDRIYDLSPTETPVLSNAGRAKATSVLFEWQTDALTTAATNNAKVQGDNYASIDSRAATVRVGNYSQISAKTALVAGTVAAVDEAGRADEMDYQLAKMAKELKRDIESAMLNVNAAGSAGNSSTAAVAAGFLAWVKTNVSYYTTDGGNPAWTSGVPAAVRTDGGTLRAIDETITKAVFQLGYANGAHFSTIMTGAFNRGVVSGFTGVATKTFYQSAVEATKIIGAADVYVSNFGSVAMIPNRFQRERDVWFLDFDQINVAFLRPFQTKDLPPGDYEAKLLLAEWTLQVKNEKGLGLAADITTV